MPGHANVQAQHCQMVGAAVPWITRSSHGNGSGHHAYHTLLQAGITQQRRTAAPYTPTVENCYPCSIYSPT
ncbi:hypothetical protein STEG23_000484 [Scotinomys teguina]